MSVLSNLTNPEIVSLYNVFAVQNGTTTVKKFRDRQTAESRLQDISRGINRDKVIAAFKKAKISKDKIALIPATPVELPKTPTAPVPMKKVKGQNPVITVANEKEAVRHEKEEKKEVKAINKERRQLSAQCIEVFKAIKQLLSKKKKGEDADSTEIAKKLSTSTATVCKAIEQLDRLQLVKMEDDSPDDNTKFYYVHLTTGGSGYEPPKEGDAVPKVKLPGENPGPRSNSSGKKLYKLVDKNPRREGTHGWKSFNLIKDGMSYEDYKAAGGRNNDLAWDVEHKFVEVR